MKESETVKEREKKRERGCDSGRRGERRRMKESETVKEREKKKRERKREGLRQWEKG